MSTLKEMSLEAKRSRLIHLDLLYGVFFFIYTLALIILFDLQQDDIIFDGGYAYYFVIYFLLPHHVGYFISLLSHLLANQLKHYGLIWLSLLAELFSLCFLSYVIIVVCLNPHTLNTFTLTLMILPLFLFIFFIIYLMKKKITYYIIQT